MTEASALEIFAVDLAAIRSGIIQALSTDQLETAWTRGISIDVDSLPLLIDEALGAQ